MKAKRISVTLELRPMFKLRLDSRKHRNVVRVATHHVHVFCADVCYLESRAGLETPGRKHENRMHVADLGIEVDSLAAAGIKEATEKSFTASQKRYAPLISNSPQPLLPMCVIMRRGPV
jgi:hypothetical protein